MTQQDNLIDTVTEEFQFLVEDYGLSPPLVTRERSMTTVDYLGSVLGVELELDWREFDFFVLVVRLENGQLPKGYYVSNGLKCRKHLVNVVGEQGWSLEGFKLNKKPNRSEDDFKQSVSVHKTLLLSEMDRLLAAGERLFLQ